MIRRPRVVAAMVAMAAMAAMSLAATAPQDFQPHPSHRSPPPPATPANPPEPPAIPPPKLIEWDPPEYPERALQFNVQGALTVKVNVAADGSVAGFEVRNGPQEFREAVRQSISTWRFEARGEPGVALVGVPFKLNGAGNEGYDLKPRALVKAPERAGDLPRQPIPGFAYVRVLIDADGKITDRFHYAGEPDIFRADADAILDALRFAPSKDKAGPKGGATLNSLLVDYASDGVIRVQQRGGAPD